MQKNSFNIYDIKKVIELRDISLVNQYLKNGWILFCVDFEKDPFESTKIYILGNTSDNPLEIEKVSKIQYDTI